MRRNEKRMEGLGVDTATLIVGCLAVGVPGIGQVGCAISLGAYLFSNFRRVQKVSKACRGNGSSTDGSNDLRQEPE